MSAGPRIAVVGATGAVGRVTLALLRERGYTDVTAFASARSAGSTVDGLTIEEATPERLASGAFDVCMFSVGTEASRELVPLTAASGALCVDKSSAFRLTEGIPLVVPEVNGDRALEHEGIVANPNCCSIPLSIALAPLRDAVGLARVRVSTYQSVSGAGAQALERLRAERPDDHDLKMDWSFDGVEFDEESKIRAETRKILELPDLPLSATCVRTPIPVGHAEAVWRPRRHSLRSRRSGSSARRTASSWRSSRPPPRLPEVTRCSSAASARTPLARTGSRCSWPATTCAKALR